MGRAGRPAEDHRRQRVSASAAAWLVAALGVRLHNIWLLYLGYGVIGGIGLGLGYIAPVSTLVKWFPDRPGMATGLAIMGFGGGALIGAPLGVELMGRFRSSTLGRREGSVPGDGLRLLRLHDVRRIRVPRAGARAGSPRDTSRPRRRRDSSRTRTSRWTSPGRRRSSGCSGSCSA